MLDECTGSVGNSAITPTVRGAWVGKCPGCGTCCYFAKLPAADYAGKRVVRRRNSDSVSVRCACGRRFQTDGNGLIFVTIASLSIERLSPDALAIEQSHAGIKAELGPMSETELWAYLNSCTLIDIIPSQVVAFLNVSNALDLDVILSVVHSPSSDS